MKYIKLGEFEEIVLLTVGILHGNAYGITIKDEIEERLKREVSVGALQTTLRRLEKKGFLDSKRGDATEQRGGRPKLYFTLNIQGKRALESAKAAREQLWNALPQYILNL
ncbi:MAG: helix-turn-helix transcriptional regulator [Bacteroidota bacterium]